MHGLGTLGLGGFAPHSEAPLLPGEGGGGEAERGGGRRRFEHARQLGEAYGLVAGRARNG